MDTQVSVVFLYQLRKGVTGDMQYFDTIQIVDMGLRIKEARKKLDFLNNKWQINY
jgi:hypothetical protein